MLLLGKGKSFCVYRSTSSIPVDLVPDDLRMQTHTNSFASFLLCSPSFITFDNVVIDGQHVDSLDYFAYVNGWVTDITFL